MIGGDVEWGGASRGRGVDGDVEWGGASRGRGLKGARIGLVVVLGAGL